MAEECYHCRGKFHEAEKCRYKDEKCYRCLKKGRKVSKCCVKLKINQRNGKMRGNTQDLDATDSEENHEEGDTGQYMMFHVASKDKEPCRVEINLNGFSTSMEVDAGATTTIISEEMFKKISQGNLVQKELKH